MMTDDKHKAKNLWCNEEVENQCFEQAGEVIIKQIIFH